MALLNTHPDYMNFNQGAEVGGRRAEGFRHEIRNPKSEIRNKFKIRNSNNKNRRPVARRWRTEGKRRKMGLEEYPVEYYVECLEYVKGKYEGQYWHVLPREMARFWKERKGQRSEDG